MAKTQTNRRWCFVCLCISATERPNIQIFGRIIYMVYHMFLGGFCANFVQLAYESIFSKFWSNYQFTEIATKIKLFQYFKLILHTIHVDLKKSFQFSKPLHSAAIHFLLKIDLSEFMLFLVAVFGSNIEISLYGSKHDLKEALGMKMWKFVLGLSVAQVLLEKIFSQNNLGFYDLKRTV